VWAVVKASALRRLGRPLLIWYAVVLGIGVVVVLASLLVMRFG
jgi:tetrahydromethanopterin S-methyltransferase subunit G